MEHINNFYNTILKSSHPVLLSAHLSGKIIPIVFYMLGSIFVSFTAQFIVIILLVAFDFYFTKNISGRKLVQLRWWYDSTNETNSTFKFESYKQYDASSAPPINPIDDKLFWWSMYLTPIIWVVFGFFCLIRFKLFYLILVVVITFLTGWNTYGFRCCDKWDPNVNANGDDNNTSWFQLPDMFGIDNLSKIARVQTFFQNATSNSNTTPNTQV